MTLEERPEIDIAIVRARSSDGAIGGSIHCHRHRDYVPV